MGPRPRHWNWRLSRRWIWLWCTNVTAWNLIKDLLILGEKWRGRATLAHNTRLGNSLPDWSLGITKIPGLMLPVSHREAFFALNKTKCRRHWTSWNRFSVQRPTWASVCQRYTLKRWHTALILMKTDACFLCFAIALPRWPTPRLWLMANVSSMK